MDKTQSFYFMMPEDRREFHVDGSSKPLSVVVEDFLGETVHERGYSTAGIGSADLFWAYQLERSSDRELTPDEARFRRGIRGGNFPDADPRGRTYDEAKFTLRLLEPKTKEVLWTGYSNVSLRTLLSSEQEVRNLMRRLLKEFPAKRG